MNFFRFRSISCSLLKQNKKSHALLALKRRKHQADLIDNAENHLLQVNTLISNVEMASMQADVVKALESGKQALKTIQAEVSVDYVSRLMDENSDLQSEVSEIRQMLSSVQTEDPGLFEEYQKLEAQVALDKTSVLPIVPSSSKPEGMTTVAATGGHTMTNRVDIFTTESSESVAMQAE